MAIWSLFLLWWYAEYLPIPRTHQARFSLGSPGCLSTCFVSQDGLELGDLPGSASAGIEGVRHYAPSLFYTFLGKQTSDYNAKQMPPVGGKQFGK